jgi:hypothetical protein
MTVARRGWLRPAGASSAGRAWPRAATILYGFSAAFLATAMGFAFAPYASASAGTGDGTNWGSGGSTGPTSSAVTVRWDNTAPGQPSYDQVPRNSSQILPYTDGATYDDANATLSTNTRQQFGNLSLTVDQTQDLQHQSVSLSYTGVANTSADTAYLDVFQCWGGSTVDGVRADEPDPTHCETLNRGLASADAPLLAKGDLPSPVSVLVSGYENPDGTSARLWAQVGMGAVLGGRVSLSPTAGMVQFGTLTGQKLGKPVPLVNGIAAADVSGLVKGASTQIIATFTPAKGQNYEPAVPSEPLTLPDAFSQGTANHSGSLIANNTGTTPYSGSFVNVSVPTGTFKAGDDVAVTLNFGTKSIYGCEYSLCWTRPGPPGEVVDHLGTATAASDGSATAAFTVPLPSSLPRVPKGDDGYVLVFTDERHLSTQVVDLANIANFPPPLSAFATSSNEPPRNQTENMPFNDIEGHPQAGAYSDFNADTTNELDNWQAPATASDTTTREFTVNTTVQDSNLGCGVETGSPSAGTCWLVVVPIDAESSNFDLGAVLSPSLWAQRLQVKLSFAAVPAFCTANDQQVIAVGSELLTNAMSSWVPAICAREKMNINFLPQDDSVARQDYEQDIDSLIFTTEPVNDKAAGTRSLYAPVGLSGVTIGLNLPTTSGQITDLKLDARLVAKLLTQSYIGGIDPGEASNAGGIGPEIDGDAKPYDEATGGPYGVPGFAPWALTTEFQDLFADPEFKALNPGFTYSEVQEENLPGIDAFGSLVVSSTASDPIGVLWHWILSDPEAKAFLDGCPDTASEIHGHPTVVNPFFSTGTYAQCRSQAETLRKTANQEIALTTSRFRAYAQDAASDLAHIVPVPQDFGYTYTYAPVTYSYSNPQFPLPDWYVIPTNGYGFSWATANSSANIHAEENSLGNVEADIDAGAPPWLLYWCSNTAGTGAACTSGYGSTGAWQKLSANYFQPVMGITDAPAAAQFQTVTAQLCDDHAHCVGADTQSLLKAESEFAGTSARGVWQTSMKPDEAHGAYPLTVPVYAAVNEKGLSGTDAADYAGMLQYISTTGNQPGLAPGLLPPGYAPLPSRMLAQDAAAVKTLDKLAKTRPSSRPTRTPTRTPTTSPPASTPPSASTSPQASTSPTSAAPGSTPATVGPSASSKPRPSPSLAAGPSASVTSSPEGAVTTGTPVGFPEYGVVVGLVGAAVCGGIAPFVERRRRLLKGLRLLLLRRGRGR